jgi:Ca2+-binding RTX toxin-like protein
MKSQFASARAQFGLARALRRGILLAIAAGLVAVPAASAVTYPVAGGNGFDTDAQGWSGVEATCSPSFGGLCSESNFFAGSQGNPPGSIESRMDVFVNAGDLFTAKATWRSPSFAATAIGSGSLSYDRQLDVTGLASLQPTSTIEAVLVDETTGQARSLGSEVLDGGSEFLDDTSTTFAAHTEVVPAGTFEVGHDYHLELRSTTTTNAAHAGVTGSSSVRFDNVAVVLKNSGPGGSTGSPGVTFTGPPLSQKQIHKLIKRVKWAAEVGHLPGGSIIPRDQCTIVGTPHADRIKGSRGNDVICGLGGNDKINGRGGRDVIDTGSGSDRVIAAGAGDAVAGLAGRDHLSGNGGGDRLGGGAGGDQLSGGARRDRINGGSGKDRVIGGRHDRVTRVERRS